jgi:hypothetical protein
MAIDCSIALAVVLDEVGFFTTAVTSRVPLCSARRIAAAEKTPNPVPPGGKYFVA